MAAPEGSPVQGSLLGRPERSRSESSSSGPGSGGRAPPPTRQLTRHPTDALGSSVGGSLDLGTCPPPSLKARKVMTPPSAAVGPPFGRVSSDSPPDAHPASMPEPKLHGSPGRAANADGVGRPRSSNVIPDEKFASQLERALQPLRTAQLSGVELWPGVRRFDDFPQVPCDCPSGASGSKSGTPEVTGYVRDPVSSSKSGDESSECSSERRPTE